MYNKSIIRIGLCDIQNNQGLGKGYPRQPSASAFNPYPSLMKTLSNKYILLDVLLCSIAEYFYELYNKPNCYVRGGELREYFIYGGMSDRSM